jgi:hypothetical protein
MKFLNFIFEELGILTYECEYKERCASYRDNSYVCTHEIDKSYCGRYRRF